MEVVNTHSVTAVQTAAEFKQFLELPYTLYANHPYWVPPLRMDQKKLIDVKKNPFYENAEIAFFIAELNGKPAGRIAAIIDHRFNEFHKSAIGHFGFFECADDQALADLLFRVAGDWLKNKGMTEVQGPANPSMLDSPGVLADGFDKQPYILMPYNFDYYPRLIVNAGFDVVMKMFAYLVNKDTVAMDRVSRALEIVKKRNPSLVIRPITKKNIEQEAEIIRSIFNEAWSANWGFIPLSKAEFDATAKDLKMIVDEDFAFIAEIDGEPVAFSISLPDYNVILKNLNGNLFPFGFIKLLAGKKKITQVRTALMGVLHQYQGRGIDALLHQRTIENGLNRNFYASELSWILETNTNMIRVAERIGAVLDKTYHMYGKKL